MPTIAPTLVGADPITPWTVLVGFSLPMTTNAALVATSSYAIGGVAPASVARITSQVVELRLSAPLSGDSWSLRCYGPESTTAVVCDDEVTFNGPRRTRTWLQAGHYQAAAATVRFTFASTPPTTADWVVPAGTWFESVDAMVENLNAALVGKARVELVPSHAAHTASVRISTEGAGPTYSITWSHAGDGTALRDRLGESGNVSGRATGTTWSVAVRAAWYSWLGAARIERSQTEEVSARTPLRDGSVMEVTHSRQPAPRVTLDVELRFGPPPGATDPFHQAHEALQRFLYDVWDVEGAAEPMMLAHWSDAQVTVDRWVVGWRDDTVVVAPEQVDAAERVWSVGLELDAESCPW